MDTERLRRTFCAYNAGASSSSRARCRNFIAIFGVYSGMDGMPPIQKYWVMTRPKSFGHQIEYVGLHPLDKIRLWVYEEILSPDVQIQSTGEGYSG